jgi:hypothetical protein
MQIRRVEVNMYLESALCDDCGDILSPTGRALLTHPPKYVHTCSKGHTHNLPHTYPRTVTVETGKVSVLDRSNDPSVD